MKGFGLKIKHYRNQKKLTQEELGNKLEVTKSYISKLESEKTTPSLEMLLNIAEVLEVDVGDLLEGKIEPPDELKESGAEWIILGKELEQEGISAEQVKQWAEIAKNYIRNDKKNT